MSTEGARIVNLKEAQDEVRRAAAYWFEVAKSRAAKGTPDDEYIASVYRRNGEAMLLVLGASEQNTEGHSFLPAKYDAAQCRICGAGADHVWGRG
jgi:hypothetical protein